MTTYVLKLFRRTDPVLRIGKLFHEIFVEADGVRGVREQLAEMDIPFNDETDFAVMCDANGIPVPGWAQDA